MFIKAVIIFLAGFLETLIYTAYLISIERRRIMLSTILMGFYMMAYLLIVAYAIKDTNSILLLVIYSLSCALGNFIVLNREKQKDLTIFKHRPSHSKHSPKKCCKISKKTC